MWLHRRSLEPSPTEVTCYWKKSRMSSIKSKKEITTAAGMKISSRQRSINKPDSSLSFLDEVIQIGVQNGSSFQLLKHFRDTPEEQTMCIDIQFQSFLKTAKDQSADAFISILSKNMTSAICNKIQVMTCDQSDSTLWYHVRYGRITASKVYEVARCRTPAGSLVETVLGAKKLKCSASMARGQKLENRAVQVVAKQQKIIATKCGLFMKGLYPIFGASPDAISDDMVIEVKCPTKEDNIKTYLSKTESGYLIKDKFRAQLQLQMLLTNRSKGLFCVAKPNFEQSCEVIVVEDNNIELQFINDIVIAAELFWKNYIFPLMK